MLSQLKVPLRLARTIAQRDRFLLRFFHPISLLDAPVDKAALPPPPIDAALIRRMIAAYVLAASTFTSNGDSMWQGFFETMHGEIHTAIMRDDVAGLTTMLRDPSQCDLFYGFDAISKTDTRRAVFSADYLYGRKLILDGLARLAEAVGARRLYNPEAAIAKELRRSRIQADALLDELEAVFGFPIAVPNPFPNEGGVASTRGVISWRVPQALYQAWRISQLVADIKNPRVLEIGGGLGRTAYYARQFGVLDYTIVDIPMTALAQGYFLGRTLGDDAVLMAGEVADDVASRVKLISPADFHNGTDHYDLIVNIDSLTELDRNVASDYIAEVMQRTDCFLSINHEANRFSVRDLFADGVTAQAIARTPCWLRQGYVEEIILPATRSKI